MSFIHYKLITNKNFEKVTFDGVSLSVQELKKLVLEKKFRKHSGPTGGSSASGSTLSNTNGTQSTKKGSDVDLEIRCVDTGEIYQKDTDLIPKNARVQINRVVRNIGPAIAGGTITATHKDNEQLEGFRLKQMKLQEKNQAKLIQDEEESISTTPTTSSYLSSLEKNKLSPNSQHHSIQTTSIYGDLLHVNDENSSNSNSFAYINGSLSADEKNETKEKTVALPPIELLCPFEDLEKNERHLMKNAVIAPCCGYFICCEECIRDRLNKSTNNMVECPREDCLQEITQHHRLTPYNPIRQKIKDFLLGSTQSVFSSYLFKKKDANLLTIKSNSITTPVNVQVPSTKTQAKSISKTSNILVKYTSAHNSRINSLKKIIEPHQPSKTDELTDLVTEINSNKQETQVSIEKSRSISPVSSKSSVIIENNNRSPSNSSNISRVSSRSNSASRSSSISKVSSKEMEHSGSVSSVSRSRSRSRSRTSTPSLKDEKLTVTQKPIENQTLVANSVASASFTAAPTLSQTQTQAQNYFFNTTSSAINTPMQNTFYNQQQSIRPPNIIGPQAYQSPHTSYFTNTSQQFNYQSTNNSYHPAMPPHQIHDQQQQQPPSQYNLMPPHMIQQHLPPQGLPNTNMFNYPNQFQRLPHSVGYNVDYQGSGHYMQNSNGMSQQFNHNFIIQQPPPSLPPSQIQPFVSHMQPNILNQMPPQWNQQLPNQSQHQASLDILNQNKYHNFKSSSLIVKRSYSRSRSRSSSRSRSRSRSSRSSRTRSRSRSISRPKSPRHRFKRSKRSRSRTRSRSRSINRVSKRSTYNRFSPKRSNNYKHERDRKKRSKTPIHSSSKSKHRPRNSSADRKPRHADYRTPLDSMNENSKHRDYDRDRSKRSRERNQTRNYKRDEFQKDSKTSYTSDKNSKDNSKIINNADQNQTSNLKTQKPKENDAKLIKDSINKRPPNEDDFDEDENAVGNKDSISKNDKFLHRLSNKVYKNSINKNNNKDSSPSIQITLPNSKSKYSETLPNQSDELPNENPIKKRFVFLFKEGNNNENNEKSSIISKKSIEDVNTNNDQEYISSDEENDDKLNKNELPADDLFTNKAVNLQKDYYNVPSVKTNNIIQAKTTNNNESGVIIRTNSTSSNGSIAKKSKRRVHLKQDIASPVFKASLMSRLSSSNQQSQQLVPTAPSSFVKQKEEESPKQTEIKTNLIERNPSFVDDNDFLDISISEKEQICAL